MTIPLAEYLPFKSVTDTQAHNTLTSTHDDVRSPHLSTVAVVIDGGGHLCSVCISLVFSIGILSMALPLWTNEYRILTLMMNLGRALARHDLWLGPGVYA